jgi:hypothetical protein
MAAQPELHIIFTLNCEPPARVGSDAPRTWEQSARGIEGFCTRILRAGQLPTLFAAPACVEEQDPLLEEAMRRGAEVGVLLHPPQIGDGRFSKSLGEYSAEDQRSLIDYAAERFADTLGHRPRSFRGGHFSASDATFRQLFELGFRQGSLSEPGRRLPMRRAVWEGAPQDPHYVDAEQHNRAGTLPFLELPVTTDPGNEIARGVPYTLQIEAGTVDALLRPTIETALERMEREQVAFRALCFYSCTRVDYYNDDDPHSKTLEGALDLIERLSGQYAIVPATIASAHDRFWAMRRAVDVEQDP